MTENLKSLIHAIDVKNSVGGEDIVALRKVIFADGFVDSAEAAELFRLNENSMAKPAEWDSFLKAAMTEFLVVQKGQDGFVTERHADWFIKHIAKDGHIETKSNLKLLLSVLNDARDGSDRLVLFALAQVRDAIVFGKGILGRSRVPAPKQISEKDVNLVERFLYLCGGDKHIAVTREEADILFEINDACLVERPAKEKWRALFVSGITNCLIYYSQAPEAGQDDPYRRGNWLAARDEFNVQGYIPEVTPQQVWDSFTGKNAEEQSRRYLLDHKIKSHSERIDEAEALWLSRRIARDGVLHDNERALLKHLEATCGYIHDSLQPFIKAA